MSRILKNHFAKVHNGQVEFSDPESWTTDKARHEGKPVYITIERVFKQRSTEQNKYYWGVIIPILSDWSGYNCDEMHEALKEKFLRIEKVVGLPSVRSTADLSTVEFSEYNESIKSWATEQGLYIPDPNEITVK